MYDRTEWCRQGVRVSRGRVIGFRVLRMVAAGVSGAEEGGPGTSGTASAAKRAKLITQPQPKGPVQVLSSAEADTPALPLGGFHDGCWLSTNDPISVIPARSGRLCERLAWLKPAQMQLATRHPCFHA